jgi:hypothetical protein
MFVRKKWPILAAGIMFFDGSSIFAAPVFGVGAGGCLLLYFLAGLGLVFFFGGKKYWLNCLMLHFVSFGLAVWIILQGQ